MPASTASDAPKREVKIAYRPWLNTAKCSCPHVNERDEFLPGCKSVGQARLHGSTAKFRVAMCGRQSGKTQGATAEIAWAALGVPGSVNWWVTANYQLKARIWRGLLEFLPAEVVKKKNETENYVILTNESEIRIKSADGKDSLVSESLDFVVCDEAGQWK